MKLKIARLCEMLLVLCVLVGVFTVSASAASDYTFDETTGKLVVYTEAGMTAWAEAGILAEDVISITVKDAVTEIKGNVFQDLVNLEELVFEGDIKIKEETITEAGGTTTYSPFVSTVKLETITFGGKVDIGNVIFNYPSGYENSALKELVFPAGSTFGAAVFSGCIALESITFEGDADVGAGSCFCNLPELKTLVFNGESNISSSAFNGTTKLESITFGGKTNIGSGIFNYSGGDENSALKELVFPAGSTFGAAVFSGCIALESITFEGDADVGAGSSFCNLPELKTLVFEGESNIDRAAFSGTTKLESITFGGKTNIGSGVFYYPSEANTALKELVFPEGSTLGSVAFNTCTALESVTFEGDITLSGAALGNLPELKTLVFKGESIINPDSLTSTTKLESITFGGKAQIASGAFSYSTPNTALKELVFPEGTTIGAQIFANCTALESITFEGDVQLTAGGCFLGNTALKSIDFKGESVISSGAFNNCLAVESIIFGGKTDVSAGIFYYNNDKPNTGIKELVFPEGSVFNGACFSNLAGLEKLVFEGDVDISDDGCFYALVELKSVEFKGTSKIGLVTFSDCGKLEKIVFADAVELGDSALAEVGKDLADSMEPIVIPAGSTVGSGAFAGAKISSVEFLDEVPPTFGIGVFDGCPEDAVIYVPEEALDAYIEALAGDGSGVPNVDDLPVKKAIERTTITVVKEWDVPEGTELPESVTVILYADGVKLTEVVLNEDNNWSYNFTDIPVTTEEYVNIIYTVDELKTPEGYKKVIGEAEKTSEGTKFVITNSLIPVFEMDSDNAKFYDSTGKEILSVMEGTVVTIKADKAPEGKVFDKWVVVSGDVILADITKEETTFKMPAGNVKIVATYKTAAANVPSDDDKLVVTDEMINEAIKDAATSDTVIIEVDKKSEEATVVELSVDAVKTVVEAKKELQLETSKGTVIFDVKALEKIVKDAGTTPSISLKLEEIKKDVLNTKQQEAIKKETVEMVISAELFCNDKLITDFGGGKVEIKIPFTPPKGTEGKDYKVLYVADDGKIEKIPTQFKDNCIIMELEHFSEYVIVKDVAEQTNTDDTSNNNANTAPDDNGTVKPGDNANVYVWVGLLAIGTVIAYKTRRKTIAE